MLHGRTRAAGLASTWRQRRTPKQAPRAADDAMRHSLPLAAAQPNFVGLMTTLTASGTNCLHSHRRPGLWWRLSPVLSLWGWFAPRVSAPTGVCQSGPFFARSKTDEGLRKAPHDQGPDQGPDRRPGSQARRCQQRGDTGGAEHAGRCHPNNDADPVLSGACLPCQGAAAGSDLKDAVAGLDAVIDIGVQDANKLWTLQNAYITSGKKISNLKELTSSEP